MLQNPTLVNEGKERAKAFAQRVSDANLQMVEMRGSLEARGWEMRWDAGDRAVHAVHGRTGLNLVVGSGCATLNGSKVPLETAPALVSGRMQIPQPLLIKLIYKTLPLSQLAKLPDPQ